MRAFGEFIADVLASPRDQQAERRLTRDFAIARPLASALEWERAAENAREGLDYWCFYCVEGHCAYCSQGQGVDFPKCQHVCRTPQENSFLDACERLLEKFEAREKARACDDPNCPEHGGGESA